MTILGKYRLKRDLPQLKAGAVFEHREYDKKHPDRGNPGCGVMILGWLNGNCQDGWCGETYIMPGQLAQEKDWFEPLEEAVSKREVIMAEIENLKRLVKNL